MLVRAVSASWQKEEEQILGRVVSGMQHADDPVPQPIAFAFGFFVSPDP